MFNKKNAFGVFVVAITLLVTWLFWVLQLNNANRLYISQVSFSNNNKQDWVEVYNPSLANVSLKHYYLSDDAEDPTRYQVPFELIVPAHGSAVLWGKSAMPSLYKIQASLDGNTWRDIHMVRDTIALKNNVL